MFCFRCGNELPPKVTVCPLCDTPQKRRQRKRRRLLLGLLLFMAGAFVGSFIDSVLFRGKSWKGLPTFESDPDVSPADQPTQIAPPAVPADGDELILFPPVATGVSTGSEHTTSGTLLPAGDESGAPSASASTLPPEAVVVVPATVATETSVASAASVASVASVVPVEVVPEIPANYRLELDSVSPFEEGPGTNYHGSVSADGRMLIFSSNRPDSEGKTKYQCYFRELPQVGPVTRLFPWNGNVWTPEFSRTGHVLVFSSDSSPAEHVFIRDLTNQQTRKLTDGTSKNMMPTISPDGNLTAFVSNRKGTNDIWMSGTDGSGIIQVTSGPEDDREPRWTPDGQSLVFTRIVSPMKVSLIMKIDLEPLGTPVPLISDQSRNWLGDPSPDGKFLAYVRSEEGGGSGNVIHIRSLERNDEITVAPFKGGEHFRPIWTSDGLGIVFHADRQKAKHLYLAKLKRIPLP